MIPREIIDEILYTAQIEDVIGEFVQLKRAGSNLKGLSPFTDEKTPSFMVSPAKQIFKCFSTGKGGNVVSFLMEYEHFSYPEALRWLADRYNIAIPEEKEKSAEQIAELNERESLGVINEFARDTFVNNLWNTDEGKAIGLSYFLERGFSEDTIKTFELGFSAEAFDSFTKAALDKGYNLKHLLAGGLTKEKNDKTFDFFRSRVMFPIHSISGKVLGFGGRTLRNDKKVAKYFNSPESILYNKSKILYGLFFSKNAIIKNDRCYLVEGYTDVISMHQAGVENVVASSGTALTKEQIKLIKRYTQNITILYDGDAAGIKASFRGIDLILEEGLTVKVVLFPEGDDPDSYSKKVSQEELKEYIDANSKDFLVFKTEILLGESKGDPIIKAKLIHEIIDSIALIPDEITRSLYIKECATQFEMDEKTLISELNRSRKNKLSKEIGSGENRHTNPNLVKVEDQPVAQQQEVSKSSNLEAHEFNLIRILIKYGAKELQIPYLDENGKEVVVPMTVAEFVIKDIEVDDLKFSNPTYQKVFDVFKEGIEQDVLFAESYFVNHADTDFSKLAVDIIAEPYQLSSSWKEKFYIQTNLEEDKLTSNVVKALYSFKKAKVLFEIDEIRHRLKNEELDDETMASLMKRQMELDKVKIVLAKELGRIIL
ncbi:MAG: DNA primase [Crocinitomicaceae bacterium]|nr:DNA primase [Crocinitomicaceae bacterium]